ncbi:hypothetical protein OZX67_05390 [Bifidobacterium sp. ESL0728]|nr:hypothetical protein [Bifidobacterium sp. ESL0728]WEV58273.1 hypothetical protein OZX67_05390 [Bifidobacterium sp. ESL0728]
MTYAERLNSKATEYNQTGIDAMEADREFQTPNWTESIYFS